MVQSALMRPASGSPGSGTLSTAFAVNYGERGCWKKLKATVAAANVGCADRLIERKPAAAEMFSEYLSRHPTDGDDPDDDDLDAELDRLFSAD